MCKYKCCGQCLGHKWLVAYFIGSGVRIYPCHICNKNGKKMPMKIWLTNKKDIEIK
jgi:hypothetical protein